MRGSSGRHRRPSGRNIRKSSGAFSPSISTTEKRLRTAFKDSGVSSKWRAQPIESLLANGEVSDQADFSQVFDYSQGRGLQVAKTQYGFRVDIVSAEEKLDLERRAHRQREARKLEKAKLRASRRKAS